MHREFGSHDRSEVHLRSLAAGSTLREGRRDDSLGVALHIVTSQGGRVQVRNINVSQYLLIKLAIYLDFVSVQGMVCSRTGY